MPAGRPKRPRDPNQLAKMVVDIATGELPNDSRKNPPARRAGGIKGGPARAKTLTAIQRRDIARVAARARWKKT
jgi:hypothetical protein